jgi:polysaccharide export outer membrane protein
MILALASLATMAQAQAPVAPPTTPETNLPAQKIGIDDLISVSVYDRPELTRTVRVAADGVIRLPLLSEPIRATGIMPSDLERIIATRLSEEEILVRPVVTVAVAEYRSRPVSVVGAVHHPLTFQVSGAVRLLDALARAEGLAPESGTEILVTRRAEGGVELTKRILVRQLIDQADPEANVLLTGGEEIRVPEAGKVFLVGNVKHPGAVTLHDGEPLTLLKALALSEGLMPYTAKEAFIYRRTDPAQEKTEIKIPLTQIVERKSPDIPLQENDLVYIPENKSRRLTLTTLDRIAAFGSAAGAAAIYGGVL